MTAVMSVMSLPPRNRQPPCAPRRVRHCSRAPAAVRRVASTRHRAPQLTSSRTCSSRRRQVDRRNQAKSQDHGLARPCGGRLRSRRGHLQRRAPPGWELTIVRLGGGGGSNRLDGSVRAGNGPLRPCPHEQPFGAWPPTRIVGASADDTASCGGGWCTSSQLPAHLTRAGDVWPSPQNSPRPPPIVAISLRVLALLEQPEQRR